MSEVRSLKILVSAHAFSPVRGSEFAVGWNYVRAIASQHKVWVIAEDTPRKETEQYLRQHPDVMSNITIQYIKWEPGWFNFILEPVRSYLIYRQWQWKTYRLARALDAQIDFDLVHQLNCIGFREPGYLWKLGKPFVWGPIGGLTFFPLRLLNAVPFRSRLFFVLKNLSVTWSMYIARRPRRAAAAARAIFAATSDVADRVRKLCSRDATVSCEVSVPDLELRPPVRRGPEEPLRIVWSGSCEPRKALNIVLLALGQLKRSTIDWRLIIVGDGPLFGNWKELASSLGIGDFCSFLGKVSRAEVLSTMASGHCFVQPSLYDATTTVLVEALAHGLPVICLDHMGFKDIVTVECGIKIPPNTVDQVIQDFAKAIKAIGLDEDRRYEMAISAQKASLRLTWQQKKEFINTVYKRVLPEMFSSADHLIP